MNKQVSEEEQKDKIKKMTKTLFKEILLAEQKFTIMDTIAYKVNGSKHKDVLVPIVDSLATSVIISLYNIYNKMNDAINFVNLIDEIIKYQSKYGDTNTKNYFICLKDKVTITNNIDMLIKKIGKTRSKKYAHLIVEFYLESTNQDIDYNIELIRRGLVNDSELINDIYTFREDISRREALRLNPQIPNERIEQILKEIEEEGSNIDFENFEIKERVEE